MSIYKDIIIEHYKYPRNRGKLSSFTHTALVTNPLCGDEFTVYLVVKKGIIERIAYTGEGCAIATATSSLLSEQLIGKDIKSINDKVKYIQELLKIPLSAGRVKCATLPLEAVEKALQKRV